MALSNLLVAASFGLALHAGSATAQARADLPLGGSALVVGTGGSGLKVRSGPGPTHAIIGVVSEGTLVTVLTGPQSDGDLTWYQIRSTDGAGEQLQGWAAGLYLVAPERIPTADDGSLGSRTFEAKVSAYATGGSVGTVTTTGTRVRWGTVSVDPRHVPLGSLLTIDGLDGVFTAEDTGPAITGAMVDVWFPSQQEALRWGVKYRTVRVLREGY